MQNINQYNPNLGTAILLVGGAGVGKTSLGMRLVKGTYIFAADPNLQSGIDYLKKISALDGNIVGYDLPFLDDEGKPVPVVSQYQRMLTKLSIAIQEDKVKAILLESAMFIEDVIKAKICNAPNAAAIKLSGYDQWGSLVLAWKSIIYQLRQSGKILIMTAHEGKERDESDSIYKYQIAVDGSIREKFPAMFSDVWRCEIQENLGQHTWNVRMLGNARQEHLKRSSKFADLKPVVTQDELVSICKQRLS
jgi:hypothetical protein